MIEKIIWKPVVHPSLGEFFHVSNTGLVKKLKRTVYYEKCEITYYDNILKPSKHITGYLNYKLSVGDESVTESGHRLVAMAFLDNPYEYKCINHKDHNKTNNNVENLEWISYSNNMKHWAKKQFPNNTKTISNDVNVNTPIKVNLYDENNLLLKEFPSKYAIYKSGLFTEKQVTRAFRKEPINNKVKYLGYTFEIIP
jgi:hypothetical protein